MKNTMKIGASLALAFALVAPTAHAATQVWVGNDTDGGNLPCYEAMVSPLILNPCKAPNVYENQIRDAWRTAAIIGYTGQATQVPSDNSDSRITALEQQNETLQNQINQLTQKVNQLSSQPIGSVTVQAPVTTGNYDARISAIEKEQKIVSGYMYILEQRIGENYARMLDLFAPIYKMLKIK